jgi:Lrp/AsnC family leucine-responsive transcriptional regulator
MAAVPPWARAASAMSAAPTMSVLEGATIVAPSSTARSTSTPLARPALAGIEACHSVAGEENYILKVRAATPTDLEDLLQQIRPAAGVSTRTTIVLSTPYENRPPDL